MMGKQEAEVMTILDQEQKAAKKKERKSKRFDPSAILLGSVLPILLILAWEGGSRVGFFPAYQLPAPTTILETIKGLFDNGTLWGHIVIINYIVFSCFIFCTVFVIHSD